MKSLIFLFKWIVLPGLSLYLIGGAFLYLFQSRILFLPQRLGEAHQFEFERPFSEVYIPVENHISLHGLLFPSLLASRNAEDSAEADRNRKLILYLHGNAGSVDGWGRISGYYADLDYDLFVLDYRGYGKSGGSLPTETEFYEDIRQVYRFFMDTYEESNIAVIGYSIGTVPASLLGAEFNPGKVILKAPFYSLSDVRRRLYPIYPDFLLRYQFPNYTYLRKTSSPLTIIHGEIDEIIPIQSSELLKPYLKEGDRYIVLENQTHNGMNRNPEFHRVLREVL